MIRKQKVFLTFISVLLIVVVVSLSSNIFFPHMLLKTFYLSYLFLLPCLAIIFTPLGKNKITSTSSSSIIHFVLFIIGIEIGALFLFCNAIHLFGTLTNQATISSSKPLLQNTFYSVGLFPWVIISVIGICFYRSSHQKTFAPFSTFFPTLNSPFLNKALQKAIDVLIQISTKLFIAINIIFFIIQAVLLLFPKKLILIPANGLFLTCFILLFYKRELFKNILKSLNEKYARQGIQFIIIFTFFTVLFIITLFIIKMLIAWQPYIGEQQLMLTISNLIDAKISLQLLSWGWWILAIPLLASWMIRIAKGRSFRFFILTTLFLPITLLILNHFKINIFLLPKMNMITTFIGALFMVTLLMHKEARGYLWFGFFPLEQPKKERYVQLDQIWLLTIGLIGLTLLLGITSLQLIVMMVALPNLCILILNVVSLFKS